MAQLKLNMVGSVMLLALPLIGFAQIVTADTENAWYKAGQAELKAKLGSGPINFLRI